VLSAKLLSAAPYSLYLCVHIADDAAAGLFRLRLRFPAQLPLLGLGLPNDILIDAWWLRVWFAWCGLSGIAIGVVLMVWEEEVEEWARGVERWLGLEEEDEGERGEHDEDRW
jgi:hypothetical protein